MKDGLIKELGIVEEFLLRSTSCLTEEDSAFSPQEGMLTVAQQVAHIAQTIDWFMEGVARDEGFDLDFESHWVEVMKYISLDSAKQWLAKAISNAKQVIGDMSQDALVSALPEGPVMGGAPRFSVVGAISDHTAHHRGALTVYSRMLGKIPQMPYMD